MRADRLVAHSQAGVELNEVTLVRGFTKVFDRLSLRLDDERIGIIGDNGAGKSSLFRLLCGLDAASAGCVRVCGQQLPGARASRTVGMMFQSPDDQIIFPVVEEELAVGLQAGGLSRRESRDLAREWLTARGLGHWAGRAISTLSQGQRQHVCWLAMTIASPKLLLLDEPFASLDLPGQAMLVREMQRAEQQIMVSTHALDHVRRFGRVIWLGDGKVLADGLGSDVCAAYEADVARRADARADRIDAARGV